MSLFRFGRAVFRSLVRNVDALREATVRVGPVTHGSNYTQALVGPSWTHTHSSGSSNSLSNFTRALFQGFVAGRANLVTSQASIFKGHAVMRMMRKGEVQGPMFAFLGLVCTNIGGKSGKHVAEEEEQFQRLHEWIQHGLKSTQQSAHTSELHGHPSHKYLKLDDYEIGERLGERSCCAAVYAASRPAQEEKLAIKMFFNYNTSSQSTALRKGFSKEAAILSVQKNDANIDKEEEQYTNLPPHPNILPVLHSFADSIPHLPGAQTSYPAALPARLGGLGRNRTFFIIMPRFDHTLKSYMRANHQTIDPQTSTLLLLQLLYGLRHLLRHKVAHRDLKSDNLLLDTSWSGCPKVAICDFGCCLAEKRLGLELPLLTDETDRGGNPMLMAPEVATAVCGDNVTINYSKSDVWAAGTIAYEMFGERNPFEHISSRTYEEEDLPPLSRAPDVIQRVVKMLLRRDPRDRLSASMAATVTYVYLAAPKWWWRDTWLVTQGDVLRWLLQSSIACMARGLLQEKSNNTWHQMRLNFLSSTSVDEVLDAVALLRGIEQRQKYQG